MIKFNSRSWQLAAAEFAQAGEALATLRDSAAALADPAALGSVGGTSIVDDAITIVAPPSAQFVADRLGAMSENLLAQSLALYNTGTHYRDVEDANTDNATKLKDWLDDTPFNA